jgi:hypothetical protein
MSPAFFTAILHVIPILFPFLPPGKRQAAHQTDLAGQVTFFHGPSESFLKGMKDVNCLEEGKFIRRDIQGEDCGVG